jgi:hypothetical protein
MGQGLFLYNGVRVQDLLIFFMRLTETIEPSYFIVAAVGFIILSLIQYKKFGKTIETKFLSGMAIFYIICFVTLNLK